MQRFVTWFSANKRDLQTALAALAMVLILVYTFWHTAALLASYVTPEPIGWIAALGIEAAVVALSLRAGAYKKTLAAALIVSAIANLERGIRESNLAHDGLTLESIQHIDPLQAFIGIASTALLSVLVFRLADIVAHDAQPAAQRVAQPARRLRFKLRWPWRKSTAAAPQPADEPADDPPPAPQPTAPSGEAQPQERTICAHCKRDYGTPNALRAHEWRCPLKDTAAVPQPAVAANGNGNGAH